MFAYLLGGKDGLKRVDVAKERDLESRKVLGKPLQGLRRCRCFLYMLFVLARLSSTVLGTVPPRV